MLTIKHLQSRVEWLNRAMPGVSIVCAGGAPRDILNGRPVKDLDFFIEGLAIDFWESLYPKLKKEFSIGRHGKGETGPHPNILTAGGKGGGYGSSYSNFYTVEIPSGWFNLPCQFVIVPPCPAAPDLRAELMTKVDFGLARVWCDATRLRGTPEYWADSLHKRLTFFGSGWGATSPERLARIREKYADYRFCNRSGAALPGQEGVV